jgi:hypothetical protein
MRWIFGFRRDWKGSYGEGPKWVGALGEFKLGAGVTDWAEIQRLGELFDKM